MLLCLDVMCLCLNCESVVLWSPVCFTVQTGMCDKSLFAGAGFLEHARLVFQSEIRLLPVLAAQPRDGERHLDPSIQGIISIESS